ncbi:MAG TPA: hypothetical protein VM890_08800, partial [Longimicrobium sp.]|nr:hypothetical protein [Longimicrobium sp.]
MVRRPGAVLSSHDSRCGRRISAFSSVDADDARRLGELARKAVRRPRLRVLDRRRPLEERRVARGIFRREPIPRTQDLRRRRQLAHQVVVDVPAEPAVAPLRRPAEEEPWRVLPSRLVHAQQPSR